MIEEDAPTEGLTSIRKYLERLAKIQESKVSLGGFVLQHGVNFDSQELTPSELTIVARAYQEAKRRCFFERGECWWNSKDLLKGDKTGTLRYAEGYALNVVPILHAWVEINGKVVDLTWRRNSRQPGSFDNWQIGTFDKSLEYYGVVFSSEELAEFMPKGKGSLIDNHTGRWPLLNSTSFRTSLNGA